MNKIALIISREYLTRVKKKSFLITTILVPIIIIAFYAAIIAITVSGSDEKQKIAILDEAALFDGKLPEARKNLELSFIKQESEQSFTGKYKDLGYDAFLYIPAFDIQKKPVVTLHSQSSASLSTTVTLEKLVNSTIRDKRLMAQGINPAVMESANPDISIQNTIDSKDGSKKAVAGVAYAVSFICGIMIYMMMLIYGTQVMRGVTEEKTNRIAEVIVSSVKPFQLMTGKIIGIGAVGLTQFAIWIVLVGIMQLAIPLIFPDIVQQAQQAGNNAEAAGAMGLAGTVMQGLSALPIGKIVFSFIFYFLGGYLTYASLFAAIGSVVSDDQQEAQQLVFPVMMPIILGFVIMSKAVNDPNSSLAVFGSIFPLTSPIVMMGRITFDVPAWQMILSMVLLIACFIFFTWITAKIYRTGILMYGKKASWKEMMKWAFRKS